MIFKQLSLQIIIRVFLIGITSFLFSWALLQDHLSIAKISIGILFVLQIFLLIEFIKRANRRFYRFMELIKNQGFMERFKEIEGNDSNNQLNAIYNDIIQLIAESKYDKEGIRAYFLETLEIIGSSIISIKENGKVNLINKAARQLLSIDYLNSIEQLEEKYPEFVNKIKALENGQQVLIKQKVGNELLMLSVHCSIFINKQQMFRVYSFQDITMELDQEELDAWQKLISVLRHEIMNSITPISSLTNTIIKLLSKNNEGASKEIITTALEGLNAIDKRNQGLLKFVESYQYLTKLPKPDFKKLRLLDLLDNIKILFTEQFRDQQILFDRKLSDETLSIYGDEQLLSQVLINLIKNSIEALNNTTEPRITIKAYLNNDNSISIEVSDNGKGIDASNINHIFIPFYTTKDMGSGIGLSLCRLIMRMHKGSINVSSVPDKNTNFTLKF